MVKGKYKDQSQMWSILTLAEFKLRHELKDFKKMHKRYEETGFCVDYVF